jgi:CBS domain containing-hemolysin-like protein
VMVPRPEVVAISAELPPEEALAAVLDSPYTRYPVYGESLDDVIGVLHVRDLFTAVHDRGLASVRLAEIVRPAYIVPETKDLASLLQEFRKTNNHFAVVVDEYGGMAGICTLEDLLEEIVGEIEDEFDVSEVQIEQIDDDTYRIDGMFPIDEFNERFGTSLPDEDFHTLAGFVFGQLGRAPQLGDDVEYDGMRFDVLEVDGNRIEKLVVNFVERPSSGLPKTTWSKKSGGPPGAVFLDDTVFEERENACYDAFCCRSRSSESPWLRRRPPTQALRAAQA